MPSSISYVMEKQAKAQDQIAMPSQINQRVEDASKRDSEANDITDRNQEARFGFTNIGGTGSVSMAQGCVIIVNNNPCCVLSSPSWRDKFFLFFFFFFFTSGLWRVTLRTDQDRSRRTSVGSYHRRGLDPHHPKIALHPVGFLRHVREE